MRTIIRCWCFWTRCSSFWAHWTWSISLPSKIAIKFKFCFKLSQLNFFLMNQWLYIAKFRIIQHIGQSNWFILRLNRRDYSVKWAIVLTLCSGGWFIRSVILELLLWNLSLYHSMYVSNYMYFIFACLPTKNLFKWVCVLLFILNLKSELPLNFSWKVSNFIQLRP